ncbi:MAG TPA: 1-deoxy-D-xylulose-5-phosphate reductoisomerase [Pirellulales bacterium]|jgi:1-deoxy-D-xylulose-5-phosphate reductoisomerase|nr:1-deoxy-D-xylulose-5-phosphate reductoisomerase [Pirellulales bacterium]
MTLPAKRIAVLGSTGSIGASTLDVAMASDGRLQIVALAARNSTEQLLEQAQKFSPKWIVVTDADAAQRQNWAGLPRETKLLAGEQALTDLICEPEIDIVVAAIVGAAGLQSTWAALQAGKKVALANKETLVMAGPLVMALAARTGAEILPIDSEHSAVFQCLQGGGRNAVKRIILTASGGPFRNFSPEQLARVTVEQALEHPTWTMGPKVTIDSATMMNKALEIVEARWLFNLKPEQIEVVIHPQSTVHSLVEFIDGSVIAQLGAPDMRVPIQYALDYPERQAAPWPRLDFSRSQRLDFEPADFDRWPALELGHQAARTGGTTGAVLNGANEEAVQSFLAGELEFTEIVPVCRSIVEHHTFDSQPTLTRLLEADRWARQEVTRWVCT